MTNTGREPSPVGRPDFKPGGRRLTSSVCSTHTSSANSVLRELPSVDVLLQGRLASALAREHGPSLVVQHARRLLDELRTQLRGSEAASVPTIDRDALDTGLAQRVAAALESKMRPILNLTGTVIHTNLGRALLAQNAVTRVASLMSAPTNLEYDLASGARGDRDSIVEDLLCQLTGAEAATVVNNNAAAVLLTIFALARGREVLVSRGELVEIGGAFRMPDVMESAGAHMVEVGTTNRTHLHDYERAITDRTGLIMKVHTSNYVIRGFTSAVPEEQLALLAKARHVPLACDLGSGSLVDFAAYGLPAEPMPQQMLRAGCDVVTFSGDKLLGGPQAGLIVGRRDAIDRIRKCPLKRALRVSKLPLAALEATLQLYLRPERLVQDLPTLRLLTRPLADIRALANQLLPAVVQAVSPRYGAEVIHTDSQIGSGALPEGRLASAGLALTPIAVAKKERHAALNELALALRSLDHPVLGRISDNQLLLDLRCLENPDDLLGQLAQLKARLTG